MELALNIPALKDPGIYVQIDGEKRPESLQATLERQGYFTEIISQPDIDPEKIEICLFGLGRGKVHGISLGLKRGMGVSSGRTLRFDDVIFISPVNFSDLLPAEKRESFLQDWTQQDAIRLGAKDFNNALESIVKNNPEILDRVIRLVNIVLGRVASLPDQKTMIFDQQRDALGTAIELFDSVARRREIFGNWLVDGVDEAECFLETVKPEYCREDIIIDSDWSKFPGWEFLGSVKRHSKKLVNGKRSLYITMANRTLIEESLGVDLVYYDKSTDIFVLVQYKNLKKESGRYQCRPESERTYKAEIARMRKADKAIRSIKYDKDLANFRALNSPFFFKFCPSHQLESRSTGLSEGFYVDLETWELFLKYGERGPRKGLVVSDGAVGKTLSNNVFTDLFNKGMIGSRASCSHLLKDIIARSIEGDRSVVTAFAEDS